uniref:Uncharacterized protein n=1 Tax=Rhizophora mucronata TaxID=61149 RepID=A0A2P2PWC1_RHIMU
MNLITLELSNLRPHMSSNNMAFSTQQANDLRMPYC